MHPKPPGHILVMLQTAKAFGLSEADVLRQPMLPGARALLDFKRCLLWEGTVAEWWFSILTEEPVGHWAAAWYKALTTHYGFTREQATCDAEDPRRRLRRLARGLFLGILRLNRGRPRRPDAPGGDGSPINLAIDDPRIQRALGMIRSNL
jgi:hypothetical protein